MIANHNEASFGLLRYFLGGYRPSQTARLTLSDFQFHEISLDFRLSKTGISTVTPRALTSPLQCLPVILHMESQKPISEYSKGSRGLSVLLRVIGIFTDTTISPSSWLRQCPDRYTIRAGRNLPDKEFRYLRTVIVTAAVYWGLDSMLRLRSHPLLTFQHRAGVRPYTLSLNFAKPCVFVKQSPGPFLCGLHCCRLPFSRSYGVNMPSSLTVIHSSTLGFSPRLPVSVYGTGGK